MPEKDQVGTGDERTFKILDDVGSKLNDVVAETSKNAGKVQIVGLILEPEDGTVHPVVKREDKKIFALGGENLGSTYPLQLVGTTAQVDWGGSAQQRTYSLYNRAEGIFKTVQTENNQLGVAFDVIKPGSSAPPDEKSGPMIVMSETKPDQSLRQQASAVLESMVSEMKGQRPEFLQNLTKGLEKAGMAKKEPKTPDEIMMGRTPGT